jgi:fructose-1,6-bisphosphatase I
LKGGWAGNPRQHLRFLHEAAPLAFVLEAAGGKGSDSDGIRNLLQVLDIHPTRLHDRCCVFLGSKLDIEELESYGDIQQSSKQHV